MIRNEVLRRQGPRSPLTCCGREHMASWAWRLGSPLEACQMALGQRINPPFLCPSLCFALAGRLRRKADLVRGLLDKLCISSRAVLARAFFNAALSSASSASLSYRPPARTLPCVQPSAPLSPRTRGPFAASMHQPAAPLTHAFRALAPHFPSCRYVIIVALIASAGGLLFGEAKSACHSQASRCNLSCNGRACARRHASVPAGGWVRI